MSLYLVFTVDGDWGEYFSDQLPQEKRRPDRRGLLDLIKREIDAAGLINGRILHFVHTSPVERQYLLEPDFVKLWKDIEKAGGGIGVHCHEEELFSEGRLEEPEWLEESIRSVADPLRDKGLNLVSYRGGYLAFCKSIIPILEKNNIRLDFSCSSGRYLHYKGKLIADWRGVPEKHYRMSYDDHRREGESKVVEIPLGKVKQRALYIDITPLIRIWRAARELAAKERGMEGDLIVSVLTHTYEFASWWKRLRIKAALLICKHYGRFISDQEALNITEQWNGAEKI